jgi:hypothetical protein
MALVRIGKLCGDGLELQHLLQSQHEVLLFIVLLLCALASMVVIHIGTGRQFL